MASGRLGAVDLSSATDTTLCTITAGTVAAMTVNICNRNSASAALVRLALAAANPPSATDYIEYDAIVPPNGVLERTGLVLDAGKLVVARADIASVTAVVYGYEDTV